MASSPLPPLVRPRWKIPSPSTQGPLDVVPGNTLSCDNGPGTPQKESAWFRRFDLGTEDRYGDMAVNSVTFGVDRLVPVSGDSVTVRVRVYSYPKDAVLTSAGLEDVPYAQALVALAHVSPARLAVAYPLDENASRLAIDPATRDAVVEIYYPGTVVGERFTVGSNQEDETASGYVRYADCGGLSEISELSTLPNGYSQVRPVMTLGGWDAGILADGDHDGVPDDPEADLCPEVQGPSGGDYPGCPLLTRTISASYAAGAITGEVGVVDPTADLAGACLPTQVRAFTMLHGAAVQVGTADTATDGSYVLTVPGGLAAGSTYVVTTERYLDGDVAVCKAAESARRQVPTPVAPPDVVQPLAPHPAPAASVAPALSGVKLTKQVIHAVGSRATPRATQVKLALNVAAGVVITVKGISAATGKTVKATVSKSLAAGASSIRFTARLGTKKLPPGTYRVAVKATNASGSATARAGRLTIKP